MIFVNHIANLMGNTIVIWAVNINKEGIMEIKFIIKIDINRGIKKLFFKFLLVKILNSSER